VGDVLVFYGFARPYYNPHHKEACP